MLTRNEIVMAALDAGFMVSSQYGQGSVKLMPVSDVGTLVEFAERVRALACSDSGEPDTSRIDAVVRAAVRWSKNKFAPHEIVDLLNAVQALTEEERKEIMKGFKS